MQHTLSEIDSLQFPAGFLWGTATSSHQVEGNNTNNQWWRFEQQPGKIWNGDRSGLACNWWRNAEADFDLMQELGLSAHRLSVEWSRIEPAPGHFDHAAIDRYRALLDGLRRRGMAPMVTLHHFTNPLWLEDRGGWENPEVVTRFQHYVRFTVSALRDLCDTWVTINEPLVYVAQGWVRGIWPPEKISPLGVQRVFRHMLQAHGVAYQTIHACAPGAQVGYAMPVRVFQPADPQRWLDRKAAGLKRYLAEHVWFMAAIDGKIRFPIWPSTITTTRCANSADFVGINFYTRDLVRFRPDPRLLFGEEHYHRRGRVSPTQVGVVSTANMRRRRSTRSCARSASSTNRSTSPRTGCPTVTMTNVHAGCWGICTNSTARSRRAPTCAAIYHWTFTDNFRVVGRLGAALRAGRG
jgi:beta-glucosidase